MAAWFGWVWAGSGSQGPEGGGEAGGAGRRVRGIDLLRPVVARGVGGDEDRPARQNRDLVGGQAGRAWPVRYSAAAGGGSIAGSLRCMI